MLSLPSKPNRKPNAEGNFTCYKCKTEKAVIKGKERACKQCFLDYVQNAFRNNLRRHLLPHNILPLDSNFIAPNYLVGVSGGLHSMTSLHLAYLNQKAYENQMNIIKKHNYKHKIKPSNLPSQPIIQYEQHRSTKSFFPLAITAIHVDMSPLFEISMENPPCCELFHYIEENYQIPFLRIPIGMSLIYPKYCVLGLQNRDEKKVFEDYDQSGIIVTLRITFQSILAKSPEIAKQILNIIRTRDIYAASHCLNFAGVILGDSAEALAHTTLNLLCTGQGINIPEEVAYLDSSKFPNYAVLRPLKNLTDKELFFYHHFTQLKTFPSPTAQLFGLYERCLPIPKHLRPSSTSILPPPHLCNTKSPFPLISQFLSDLSVEFPSTIMNINQTCAKLESYFTHNNTNQRCQVCLGIRDNLWQAAHSQASFCHNLTSDFSGTVCSGCLNNINKLPLLEEIYELLITTPLTNIIIN